MIEPLALIIEDDVKLADIFSIAVQRAGFDVEIFDEGERALARLREIVPALILLDLHLPRYSGEEILQQIKKDKRLSGAKTILTTADSLKADWLVNEVDLVLLKPIDPIQLSTLAARLRPYILDLD